MSHSLSNTTITSADRSGGQQRPSSGNDQGANTNNGGNSRDRRNRNRGARSNNNNNNNNIAGSQATASNGDTRNKNAFKGEETGMNGHIFGCYDEQPNKRQYALTMAALRQFACKTYKFANDFECIFHTTPREPLVPRPRMPSPTAPTLPRTTRAAAAAATTDDEASPMLPGIDPLDELIFKEKVKEYVTRCSTLESNMAAIWSVTYGQCTRAMRDKLEAHADYESSYQSKKCIWLFATIRGINLKFDQTRYAHLALVEAFQHVLSLKQTAGQTVNEFSRDLITASDTIEHYGGSVVLNPFLASARDSTGNARTAAERHAASKAETLALLLLRGSDQSRYGSLLGHLANQFANGRDEYPKDIATATSLLIHYHTPTDTKRPPKKDHADATGTDRNAPRQDASDTNPVSNSVPPAVTFTQGNNPVETVTVTTPTAASVAVGASLLHHGIIMTQPVSVAIHPWSILLDSQSTISVFNNAALLSNIRPAPRPVRAITNGGHQDSTMVGDFPNLGAVYFNPDSIANILSLAKVMKVRRVTMDSTTSRSLDVHRLNGTIMRFTEQPNGLFIYAHPTDPATACSLVSTVANNKTMYTKRQIAQADDARRLYRLLGRPDESVFHSLLSSNFILNCPLTVADAIRATAIYGPEVATLKGKTTRATAAARAPRFDGIPLPPDLLSAHQRVTLCVDFFFVQELCFLHTISRDIHFRTVSPVGDRTRPTMRKELLAVIAIYTARGFHVVDIHGDSEFACIRHDFPDVHFNIVAADGHVGEVERSIRTVKERLRALLHGLPYRRVPKLLLQRAVIDVNRLLNLVPASDGISPILGPASIVTGQLRPDFSKLQLEFGTYVQLFDDFSPTNTPRARTMGAITLDPSGNSQGAYHFMSLATGALLSRHRWTVLPISDATIARVEALAHRDGQPPLQTRNLVVEYDPDQPIDEDTYDLDYSPPPDPIHADVLDASYDPIDPTELSDLLPSIYTPPSAAQGANIDNVVNPATNDGDDEDDNGELDDDNPNVNNQGAQEHQGAQDNELTEDQGAHMEDQEAHTTETTAAAPAPPYNLRSRVTNGSNTFNTAMDAPYNNKSYYPPRVDHLQVTQYLPPKTIPTYTMMHNNTDLMRRMYKQVSPVDSKTKFAMDFVLAHVGTSMEADAGIKKTQMSFKQGLKQYGRAAEEALMKEFAQLEDLNVYEPVNARLLLPAQRHGALRAINLIKEKRNGVIKGRTVADGRIQRPLYEKAETASPTIATDALMLSIIVDAYEGRDVATADIAGAYLKAYMDDFVLMKFSGATVPLLCNLNPKHKPFVVIENGQEVLYVRLIKALYGCVKSALLWYELFSNTLQTMGFVLNPYDRCVANCMIEGKQCTIGWYVDDTKITHENPNVVTAVLDKLESEFGKMSITRGDEHVFLGMKITYNRKKRTATVDMKDYLVEALAESGLAITKAATTPAAKDLFSISAASPFLTKRQQEVFHSVVAKLLYVSIRARMDLLLATSFLATRVSKSTQQDLDKLQRLLEYIYGSIDDTLILGSDDIGRFRVWVDASYAVHPDFRSHTGGCMSFGTGAIACKSTKQKLNTKSSTEAEIVGASDYMPNALWTKMFMEAQGYNITNTVLEQDNESAIKLSTNGRASAGPKSRHVDIRYFWLKDRISTGDITIRHCPTHQMLADFFTKPLQGSLFQRFKAVVLGHQHTESLHNLITHSLEERVGKDERSNSNNSNYMKELDEDVERVSLILAEQGTCSINPTYADVVKRTSVDVVSNRTTSNKSILSRRSHSLERIQ